MRKPILFLCMAVLITVTQTACDGKSTKDNADTFPTLGSQNVTANGCLNVALIQQQLVSGSYPAVAVTTDFQADPSLNSRKNLFHTYSAFDVRNMVTNDIQILIKPQQSDCSEVRTQTISGESLVYKVTDSSTTTITLELQKSTNDGLSEYRLKALRKKMQPIQYKLELLGATHMRVTTTYKGFDAHCRGSEPMSSKIQIDYLWGMMEASSEVQIKNSFYQKVVSTLKSGSGEDSNSTPLPLEPLPDEPQSEPQPQPAPELPAPTDPSIPTSPADPANPNPDAPVPQPDPSASEIPLIPSLPEVPEAVVMSYLFSRVVIDQLDVSSDYKTISIGELRALATQPAKDEIVKCAR